MDNWSLALRVRLLVGLTSAAVLVLAVSLLGWHSYQNGREQLVQRTLGIARVAAANAVVAIEYDPGRSARIALLEYSDKEKTYIVAPDGIKVGDTLMSGDVAAPTVGNALPLGKIPVGVSIHNIELVPGRGAQIVRSAGSFATLMSRDGGYAQVKLPSGEIRLIHERCLATIGQVGNAQWENITIGKAGRNVWLGKRGMSRGMVRNPVDHPNGGGQGKSKGGGGRQHLMSPWGKLAKGARTRNKRKISNRFILVRRDGRPMKLK